MILEKKFPCVAQKCRFIKTPVLRGQGKHDAQRFETPFKLRLRPDVGHLQRNPCGKRAGKKKGEVAVSHFIGDDGKIPCLRPDPVQKLPEGRLPESGKMFQHLRQVLLRFQMVDSVHQQPVGGGGFRVLILDGSFSKTRRPFRIRGEALEIVVPAAQKRGQNGGAVGTLPEEFISGMPIKSASENAAVDSKARENLRKLTDQTELIGCVADIAASPELSCDSPSRQKIADSGFSAGQEEVVLNIPGADAQIAFPDIVLQNGALFRTDLQIVLQTDGLRIQFKDVVRICAEDVQQMIQKISQPQAELLKRLIPFAVPMGVGNHMKMKRVVLHFFLCYFAFGVGDAVILAAGIQRSL